MLCLTGSEANEEVTEESGAAREAEVAAISQETLQHELAKAEAKSRAEMKVTSSDLFLNSLALSAT